MGLPNDSAGKESSSNEGEAEVMGSIPEWERFPGGGNGNSLQYSCLKNPKNKGAWWAIVQSIAKNRTQLSDYTSISKKREKWNNRKVPN